MSRTKQDPARNRTHQVNIRLTTAEAAEVHEQARRRGMSVTRLLLEAVRAVSAMPYDGGFRPKGPARLTQPTPNP